MEAPWKKRLLLQIYFALCYLQKLSPLNINPAQVSHPCFLYKDWGTKTVCLQKEVQCLGILFLREWLTCGIFGGQQWSTAVKAQYGKTPDCKCSKGMNGDGLPACLHSLDSDSNKKGSDYLAPSHPSIYCEEKEKSDIRNYWGEEHSNPDCSFSWGLLPPRCISLASPVAAIHSQLDLPQTACLLLLWFSNNHLGAFLRICLPPFPSCCHPLSPITQTPLSSSSCSYVQKMSSVPVRSWPNTFAYKSRAENPVLDRYSILGSVKLDW